MVRSSGIERQWDFWLCTIQPKARLSINLLVGNVIGTNHGPFTATSGPTTSQQPNTLAIFRYFLEIS